MTSSSPSPAMSETLSSCSTAEEGLDDISHSEPSSPEKKRPKRHNMRTRLEDIMSCRFSPESIAGTGRNEDSSKSMKCCSQNSYKSADYPTSGFGNSQNLCCSLPDMNLEADNECKGLGLDCDCACNNSDSSSEPTEISLELRTDRRRQVVSSYYSHFKQIRSTPSLQNEMSKVGSDGEALGKENDSKTTRNNFDDKGSPKTHSRNNVNLSRTNATVAAILNQDQHFVCKSHQKLQTACNLSDCSPSPMKATDVCQHKDDLVCMPPSYNMEDSFPNDLEIVSMDDTSLGDLPRLPVVNEDSGQTSNINQARPSVNSYASAGENAGSIEVLSPIIPVQEKASPAGESFPGDLSKAESVYENSKLEMENSKVEPNLEVSVDSGQFLGSRRIEKEFKSELEFSTVLTLAYVRVRDLTNSIDKAQEYLAKLDKTDDEVDIDGLRNQIQALFDSRAALSLEHTKWRSQFSEHYHLRKRVLANLKARACRTEQNYFKLRKELMDLEKEPITPKRKRSLLTKILTFGLNHRKTRSGRRQEDRSNEPGGGGRAWQLSTRSSWRFGVGAV
ncbi:hypothetical protein GE061_002204 [Apolygus lucorum]|uniref:Uncharacterized protein n=1 Tax=Apolygus lucorum TaxID=248454 RepID=A0A8S9X5X1_APOLU|nr:hypothetical protein GE061_002204 [Apolygus lucorum]